MNFTGIIWSWRASQYFGLASNGSGTIIGIFFRDNGISIQILMYQCCTEIFMFLLIIVFNVIIPIDRGILMTRIIGLLNTFFVFVIQPLFYLNGDVNFRNRVMNHGLWQALKSELFYSHNAVSPFPITNQHLWTLYYVDCPFYVCCYVTHRAWESSWM